MKGQPLVYTLRLALRSLQRGRAASVMAVLTLGIGLCAAVVLLGIFDSAVRSLPVPGGDAVVEFELRDARARRVPAPLPLESWVYGPGVVQAGALRMEQATIARAGTPAFRAYGAAMHPSVLQLLRVQPVLGRLPSPELDDEAALVVGWETWQQLGADATLLGSMVELDGRAHTLIGVMPAGFGFPERQSYWTVLPPDETGEVVVRLEPGASAAAVQRGVEARLARLNAAAAAGDDAPARVEIQPWTQSRESGGEGALFVGLAVLVVLLLVVCAANVATLLLVRGNERATVLAVHAALGAPRSQVALQLFTEALLVAAGGGIVGLLGGFLVLRWMELALSSHWGYYWMAMEVRLPVLFATVGLVLITALLAGTAPALRASRVDLARVLVSSGRSHDPKQRRLGRWFVGAQVGLSTIGLIAAAFLVWEFLQVNRITGRLPIERLAVAAITLPERTYEDAASRAALVRQLQHELRGIGGVRHVSIGGDLPGGRGLHARLRRPGDDAQTPGPAVAWLAADPDLTTTYGMRLIAGRLLTERDGPLGPRVALVTPAFAARYLEGEPLGASLRLESVHDPDTWVQVVGVVEDWFPGPDGSGVERIVLPIAQTWPPRLAIAVWTSADPSDVLPAMRAAVARVDERLPLEALATLRDRMNWFLRMPRVISVFGVLGGAASAIVAAIGLYGVMAFQVRTRLREIGIRMAVGATPRRIAFEIVRESVLRVAPGLAFGVGLGLLAGGSVGGLAGATEVAPAYLILACVTGSMLLIGVAAGLAPAVHASRLDPQEVLRSE